VLRRKRGLSQENLTEIIGMSRQAIAKWEDGRSYPDVNNLIQISDLFKVSIDKLVRDEEYGCCFINKEVQINEIDGDIIAFLCRAKKSTSAGKGVEGSPSRPNSHDLYYSEGNLEYIDTYLGGKNFAEKEALWVDDIPIGSMNYIGRILGNGFS